MVDKAQAFDVIIIGGGMVGLSLAVALAKLPLKIAIVDKKEPDCHFDPNQYATRVSAINRATQNYLANLGVWSDIEQLRVSPYQKMYVWDSAYDGEIEFDADSVGEEVLGHIIENQVITACLTGAVADAKNITTFYGDAPCELSIDDAAASLHLNNDTTLTTKLLCGADGAYSWIREHCQIACTQWDYGQSALVCTVTTENPHQDTAWQRFLPQGPLAFLPLADPHQCSIVWSTTPDNARELLQLEEANFKTALADAFADRLGDIQHVDQRKVFPLAMSHAKEYVRPRIALLGDAIHTIHPLAGQGVNLGFMDAAVLAEVIEESLLRKQEIGDFAVLRRYERWRKGDVVRMIALMEGLKRLFSNDNSILSWFRARGLDMVNSISPLKNRLIAEAMGKSDGLPRLATRNKSLS